MRMLFGSQFKGVYLHRLVKKSYRVVEMELLLDGLLRVKWRDEK